MGRLLQSGYRDCLACCITRVQTRQDQNATTLIFASAVYQMAPLFLNSAAVPLEEGQARFPDGVMQAEVPAA